MPLPGRPPSINLIQSLVDRLLEDESWQAQFSDEERSVWINAAGAYLRLQLREGLDLELAYARVLRMLQAAKGNGQSGPKTRFALPAL
jgi:hypothetical protein